MNNPRRYRKAVLISTLALCLASAVAWYVVPGVRGGTVPAVGGMIWHALGPLELLLTRVYAPAAAQLANATAPAVGILFLPAMVAISALLASLLACLPFGLISKR